MTANVLAIQSILLNVANWRRKMMSRFPNDKRNHIAIQIIHQLATQPATDVPAPVLSDLATYPTPTLCTVAEGLGKHVGFRLAVGNLTEFLDAVMDAADEHAKASRAAADANISNGAI